ncbi:hypothetical protein [Priestia abyssalis]|uniref:hypothetical protein n=1 Tax=Priestia abyssalis TaxID=1221450 RepID=UPI0009952BF5|nr:hypothetical protein [Priestia abyssalis]
MKKQKPEPLERKIVQHSFNNHHSQELISVGMKGFASNETELKLNALKLLISCMDVDDACEGDLSVFEMLMDQLLLSTAEQLGAEGWYDLLPEELLPYNPDTNEMEISELVNWLLLKQYVDGKVAQLLEKKPTEH